MVSRETFELAKQIPASERDVEALLRFNNFLVSYDSRLRTHERKLRQLDPDLLKRTRAAILQAQGHITTILGKHSTGSGTRSRRIEQALRTQSRAPTQRELSHAEDRPETLVEAMDQASLDMSKSMRSAMKHLDEELHQRLSQSDYSELVDSFQEYLSENL